MEWKKATKLLSKNFANNREVVIKKFAMEFDNFRYDLIYAKRSRFILILDRSKAMNLHKRWDILHDSISEFLTQLPDNSEVSIITFAKNAIMHLPPTVITANNRNGIIGRLPKRTSDESSVCLFCAFNVTFKALQDYQGQIQPATVIFVSGTEQKPGNLEILAKLFENAQVQFFTISYPGTAFMEILELSKANGRHYTVHDGPSYLYTFSQLSQIFTGILANVEGKSYSTLHIQLFEELNISGNFRIEDSAHEGFWISLLIENPDHLQYFELKSPSGQIKMFPHFMQGFVQFHIRADSFESGTWTYTAVCYPDLDGLVPKTIVKVVTVDTSQMR